MLTYCIGSFTDAALILKEPAVPRFPYINSSDSTQKYLLSCFGNRFLYSTVIFNKSDRCENISHIFKIMIHRISPNIFHLCTL